MSRSAIIKELANGQVSLETAFLRLKVILSYLNNDLINLWIDKELNGYESHDELPSYRKTQGTAYGTVITGNRYNGMKYTNALIPLISLSNEDRVALLQINIFQGISAIEKIIDEGDFEFAKPIGREITQIIETGMNAHIASMQVKVEKTDILRVISTVKMRILDIFIGLEKEFGNLDDYDALAVISDNPNKIEKISNNIISIIYDNSVEIGDGNKIVKSNFGDSNE